MKIKILFTALAFIATVGFVSAQNANNKTTQSETRKSCYVDKNNNNVCDNYENKTCSRGNGYGLRDGSGKRQTSATAGKGRRNGRGLGCRNAKGANFIDTNNNGICDNREQVKK